MVIVQTQAEFKKTLDPLPHHIRIKSAIENTGNCKLELLKEAVVGSFLIPDKKNLMHYRFDVAFYVTVQDIYLIGDKKEIGKILSDVAKITSIESLPPLYLLFEMMEIFIKDDSAFLQRYEEKLENEEAKFVDSKNNHYNEMFLKVRKELMRLQSYYQQLIDMSETLIENDNQMVDETLEKLLNTFSKRADRLFDHTHRIKEYMIQISELHQNQLDIRQNAIMKVLTVVTTIFMPLTLITGWYGMNFQNMPELQSDYGYLVVILVSIVVIALEVWIFKIKDWF